MITRVACIVFFSAALLSDNLPVHARRPAQRRIFSQLRLGRLMQTSPLPASRQLPFGNQSIRQRPHSSLDESLRFWYPKYYGGFHSRFFHTYGYPPGDIGFRGYPW